MEPVNVRIYPKLIIQDLDIFVIMYCRTTELTVVYPDWLNTCNQLDFWSLFPRPLLPDYAIDINYKN
jgi:hypothetical protein